MSGHSAGQGVALGAAGAAAGAVHVLGAEAPGLRRGLPLVGAVHRLSDPPPTQFHRLSEPEVILLCM